MTKFIPAISIRDFTLPAIIMQDMARIIEIENSTHGYDLRQYVDIGNDGVVVRAAMILVEGEYATALYTHAIALDDTEALVREVLPTVTQLQTFVVGETAPASGWRLLSANFKSRVAAPVTKYQFIATDNPLIKDCRTTAGSVMCSVIGNFISVALNDEPIDRTTQQAVDTIGGVAVTEQKTFTVQCMSKAWAEAFEMNPNYVFQNALVVKTLR